MGTRDRYTSAHQVLHGYRDGHEQLAASLKLPKAARRQMLALSDLSGDEPLKGFRTYLTAYPVAESDLYAVCRTWYASEMSRPGCVWTHSILVHVVDLTRELTLGLIAKKFTRPKKASGFGRYTEEVGLTPDGSTASRVPPARALLANAVLCQLYAHPDASVIIPAAASEDYDDVVASVWEGQWLALRGAFRFCTGALAFRRDGECAFDLQVMPERAAAKAGRRSDANDVIVLNPSDLAYRQAGDSRPPAKTEWLSMLGFNFDEVLLEFGGDLPGERRSMKAIMEITKAIELLHGAPDASSRVADLLAEAFPDARGAGLLKRALLGPADSEQELLSRLPGDELQKVTALLTASNPGAFDLGDLQAGDRLCSLLADSKGGALEAARWLLDEQGLSASGLAIRDQAVASVPLSSLYAIHSHDRALAKRMLLRFPDRFADPGLWNGPREFQLTCLEAASERGWLGEHVARAMVSAHGFCVHQELASRVDRDFADAVLSALGSSISLGPGSVAPWIRALAPWRAQISDWIASKSTSISPGILVAIALDESPYSDLLQRVPAIKLLRIFELDGFTVDKSTLAAALLAIGLERPGSDGSLLVCRVFETVHAALLGARLSWQAWQWLDLKLPSDIWTRIWEWDRAGRLRRGLVSAYLDHADWAPEHLREALANPATQELVLSLLNQTPGGKSLLRRSGL